MKLIKALMESEKVRRDIWPAGVYLGSNSHHRIGSEPTVMCDVDSKSDEPVGIMRNLTLRKDDPAKRSYGFQDLGGGLVRPKHDVVQFIVPQWQPSVDDLFATDWIPL